uniref:Peptidase metallopeptidase domain-containing protein n=1 Tax=Sphaeramia orbicularis TaxID=375764 RepID=A0A672YG10_9TELE
MKIFNLSVLLSLAVAVYCAPVSEVTVQDEDFVKNYLKHFFNRMEESVPMFRRGGIGLLAKKLSEMQRFFGLHITGTLDPETVAVMTKPRCGFSETVARYSTSGSKWENNTLTYRIKNYTLDMLESEVDDSIDKALQVWAKVTPLRFTKIYSGTADIMISFERGDHGDNSPFDGRGNTYGNTFAHAFPPGSGTGGDVHFDDDDTFTFRSRKGSVLFIVAAHEFGHSLGLSHSNDPAALMFSAYVYRNPDTFVLPQDDVNDTVLCSVNDRFY